MQGLFVSNLKHDTNFICVFQCFRLVIFVYISCRVCLSHADSENLTPELSTLHYRTICSHNDMPHVFLISFFLDGRMRLFRAEICSSNSSH